MTDRTEPVWLTAAIDQRLALMVEVMGPAGIPIASDYGVMMTPLTEPPEGSSREVMEVWDHSCDCCGKHCSPTEDFFLGSASRKAFGTQVCFTFAMCGECSKKE